MVDVFRSMLDELMGKERNVPLTERTGRGLRFEDPDVCKHQLAGLCPFQLFKNTKSDLGEAAHCFRTFLSTTGCSPLLLCQVNVSSVYTTITWSGQTYSRSMTGWISGRKTGKHVRNVQHKLYAAGAASFIVRPSVRMSSLLLCRCK